MIGPCHPGEAPPIGHDDQVQRQPVKVQRCMALVASTMEISQARYRTVEVQHELMPGAICNE
jgi:hypothetical protein